jgi:hypothetical protein
MRNRFQRWGVHHDAATRCRAPDSRGDRPPLPHLPDAAEKSRWHVLWLVTQPGRPVSTTAAAKVVGYTPAWGRAILKRYNAGGPDALTDGRRGNGADRS